MSQESDPLKTTYFIDAENAGEMARLINQDRILTRCMGGLFQPQLDLANTHDILDLACGPGGWAMDVARAYPDKRVTGIDISQLMIEFAHYQAADQKLYNVNFQVMDALKPLAFPDSSFDYVNARFISGFMPKLLWPQFTRECLRILRPGGVIRLAEYETTISNSSTSEKLGEMFARALHKAGQSFSPTGWQFGITPVLGRLLRDAGCLHIQRTAHVIDWSAGTEEHLSQFQNAMVFLKLSQPFLVKMGVTTQEEAESLYQRALEEMMSPDYCALWYFLSVWGEKPR